MSNADFFQNLFWSGLEGNENILHTKDTYLIF